MRSLTNLGKRVHRILRDSAFDANVSYDNRDNIDFDNTDTLIDTVNVTGGWVDGEWVEPTKRELTIYANIQPSLLSYQSKMLPESEREKEAIAIFSNHHLYTARTGNPPLEADLVSYRGAYWKVVVSKPYNNFGEHCEAIAVRLNDSESPRITGEVRREGFDGVVIV